MDDADDLHRIGKLAVHDDERKWRKHQLARTVDPSWPSPLRQKTEAPCAVVNRLPYAARSYGVVLLNVFDNALGGRPRLSVTSGPASYGAEQLVEAGSYLLMAEVLPCVDLVDPLLNLPRKPLVVIHERSKAPWASVSVSRPCSAAIRASFA